MQATMTAQHRELENGIHMIDAGYVRPQIAAFYAMVEAGGVAFFDTGTTRSLPRALDLLDSQNLRPEDVDYVIPTHVHLDHAGGAGAMMRAFPNAKLVVHPRGAEHMIDPAKLIQGTVAVYGEAKTDALYGEIVPVPRERVIIADDGYELELRGRRLRFLDTPGHARHHFCVFDDACRGLFSGDTFGIAYPPFTTEKGPFLFPTTTPVQFEPDALHASVDRLAALGAERVYLTHFGRIVPTSRLVADLHQHIDHFVEIAQAAADPPQLAEVLESRIGAYLYAAAKEHGCRLDDGAIRDGLAMDVTLNAQGLAIWLKRRAGTG